MVDRTHDRIDELKACPFCAAGSTIINTSDYWTGMRHQILSATIQHWCEEKPHQSFLQIKGKTVDEAIEKWNWRK